MDFKAESFPLYVLLVENNEPGVEAATRAFELAAAGGDEERYNFAIGIQTVAYSVAAPGQTEEINKETLKGCLAVFEDQGERHAQSAFMAAYNRLNGLGCDVDKAAARKWLDKAAELGGETDMITAMRIHAADIPPEDLKLNMPGQDKPADNKTEEGKPAADKPAPKKKGFFKKFKPF